MSLFEKTLCPVYSAITFSVLIYMAFIYRMIKHMLGYILYVVDNAWDFI